MRARLLFAYNLKQQRHKKSLSQEELAELSDLHRTYISAVERGVKNISIDNMERLANALNMDLIELLEKNGN
ncbi:helix-turn-helix domain-containing protein [Aggregatibacter actinomycetemcomitans]|jgi:subunit S of type I restriction-modification system|uniref:helix-turn-helix domain-containing protein n=1 Tax=Aggregatibacter actinomycetemcomitans TaxID=714 RepID=UPI001E28DE8C|nr:helix-turn-helix transcriptional regulator [Aggregatibacter actinomycetemcomitans]